MNELINNDLAELQKELELLQSASKQIQNAGDASLSTIEAVQELKEKFDANLEKLTKLYTQYVEDTNKKFEEFKKETKDEINQSIKRQEDSLQVFTQSSEQSVKEQENLLKKSSADSSQKISELSSLQKKQVQDTNKLLDSYLELAQSTAELEKRVNKIDFPNRFEKLSAIISALNSEQQESNKSLKEIIDENQEGKIEKMLALQDKKINSLRVLCWIITIVSILGFGAIAYFEIFKPMLIK